MPRVARIVGTGYPHHVVQRGNNREKVFLNKADYRTYLSYLERYSTEKKVAILAYCLMSNHVHLLLEIGTHPIFLDRSGTYNVNEVSCHE